MVQNKIYVKTITQNKTVQYLPSKYQAWMNARCLISDRRIYKIKIFLLYVRHGLVIIECD